MISYLFPTFCGTTSFTNEYVIYYLKTRVQTNSQVFGLIFVLDTIIGNLLFVCCLNGCLLDNHTKCNKILDIKYTIFAMFKAF